MSFSDIDVNFSSIYLNRTILYYNKNKEDVNNIHNIDDQIRKLQHKRREITNKLSLEKRSIRNHEYRLNRYKGIKNIPFYDIIKVRSENIPHTKNLFTRPPRKLCIKGKIVDYDYENGLYLYFFYISSYAYMLTLYNSITQEIVSKDIVNSVILYNCLNLKKQKDYTDIYHGNFLLINKKIYVLVFNNVDYNYFPYSIETRNFCSVDILKDTIYSRHHNNKSFELYSGYIKCNDKTYLLTENLYGKKNKNNIYKIKKENNRILFIDRHFTTKDKTYTYYTIENNVYRILCDFFCEEISHKIWNNIFDNRWSPYL
jgi:hypothetical protein